MKKFSKTVGTLGLVGCAVIISPLAMAGDSGWYMGGNIGKSAATIDDERINNGLLGGGFATTSITNDNRNTGYKFFGGYKFNKDFALEGGYFDLGKFGFSATTLPAGILSSNIKLDGMNLDVVGFLPMTEKFSVLGRIGLNYAEAKDSFSGTVALPVNINPSKRDTNYKFGFGVQYDSTQSLGMRAEAERYRINDAVGNKGNIDLVSVGLVYRFGVEKSAPAPIAKAVVIEPVAEAAVIEPVFAIVPAPQPVVAILPPIPQQVAVLPRPLVSKVVFSADSSADSLFDFDTTTLNSTGQLALDKFAATLKNANFNVIKVTGHADRIGSFAYNMKLSKLRAEAVADYLVESSGIPFDKISAIGMGDSDPVTKPGDCKGKNETKKLIACLGPDRRVEIEVSAIRTSRTSQKIALK